MLHSSAKGPPTLVSLEICLLKQALLVRMRKSAVFEDERSTREGHMVEEHEQLDDNVIYLLLRLTDK